MGGTFKIQIEVFTGVNISVVDISGKIISDRGILFGINNNMAHIAFIHNTVALEFAMDSQPDTLIHGDPDRSLGRCAGNVQESGGGVAADSDIVLDRVTAVKGQITIISAVDLLGIQAGIGGAESAAADGGAGGAAVDGGISGSCTGKVDGTGTHKSGENGDITDSNIAVDGKIVVLALKDRSSVALVAVRNTSLVGTNGCVGVCGDLAVETQGTSVTDSDFSCSVDELVIKGNFNAAFDFQTGISAKLGHAFNINIFGNKKLCVIIEFKGVFTVIIITRIIDSQRGVVFNEEVVEAAGVSSLTNASIVSRRTAVNHDPFGNFGRIVAISTNRSDVTADILDFDREVTAAILSSYKIQGCIFIDRDVVAMLLKLGGQLVTVVISVCKTSENKCCVLLDREHTVECQIVDRYISIAVQLGGDLSGFGAIDLKRVTDGNPVECHSRIEIESGSGKSLNGTILKFTAFDSNSSGLDDHVTLVGNIIFSGVPQSEITGSTGINVKIGIGGIFKYFFPGNALADGEVATVINGICKPGIGGDKSGLTVIDPGGILHSTGDGDQFGCVPTGDSHPFGFCINRNVTLNGIIGSAEIQLCAGIDAEITVAIVFAGNVHHSIIDVESFSVYQSIGQILCIDLGVKSHIAIGGIGVLGIEIQALVGTADDHVGVFFVTHSSVGSEYTSGGGGITCHIIESEVITVIKFQMSENLQIALDDSRSITFGIGFAELERTALRHGNGVRCSSGILLKVRLLQAALDIQSGVTVDEEIIYSAVKCPHDRGDTFGGIIIHIGLNKDMALQTIVSGLIFDFIHDAVSMEHTQGTGVNSLGHGVTAFFQRVGSHGVIIRIDHVDTVVDPQTGIWINVGMNGTSDRNTESGVHRTDPPGGSAVIIMDHADVSKFALSGSGFDKSFAVFVKSPAFTGDPDGTEGVSDIIGSLTIIIFDHERGITGAVGDDPMTVAVHADLCIIAESVTDDLIAHIPGRILRLEIRLIGRLSVIQIADSDSGIFTADNPCIISYIIRRFMIIDDRFFAAFEEERILGNTNNISTVNLKMAINNFDRCVASPDNILRRSQLDTVDIPRTFGIVVFTCLDNVDFVINVINCTAVDLPHGSITGGINGDHRGDRIVCKQDRITIDQYLMLTYVILAVPDRNLFSTGPGHIVRSIDHLIADIPAAFIIYDTVFRSGVKFFIGIAAVDAVDDEIAFAVDKCPVIDLIAHVEDFAAGLHCKRSHTGGIVVEKQISCPLDDTVIDNSSVEVAGALSHFKSTFVLHVTEIDFHVADRESTGIQDVEILAVAAF